MSPVDGEWHRLHPASPLLRGGFVLIAVAGWTIAQLRERLLDFAINVVAPDSNPYRGYQPGGQWANDPVGAILAHDLVGWALLAVVVVVVVVIGGFWLSWRMHAFRVTPDAVEVRSGILFRSHRSARLDRIQGINISRPLFARIFGAAKLDVEVAGQSGQLRLSYLGSKVADELRAELLRLASGARASKRADAADVPSELASGGVPSGAVPSAVAAQPGLVSRAGDLVNRRVDEFLAPELDPALAAPASIVHLPVVRIVVASLIGDTLIWVAVMAGLLAWGIVGGHPWLLFSFIPGTIGVLSLIWRRIQRAMRYTIAGTPHGIRVGHGLLSTENETIPPGRIHAIEASQWLLWRPFGWWSMQINLAGHSTSSGRESSLRTLVLPVGTADDVQRVLALMLPDVADEVEPFVVPGLSGRRGERGFSMSPGRSFLLRPFSWRRVGWAEAAGILLLRRGWLTRRLVTVPLARMQSVAVTRGPLHRMLRLAAVRVHTVHGPVRAELPVADASEAAALFAYVAHEAVERAAREAEHG